MKISEKVKYIGVDDIDIDLFENQYKVKNGVSYNSYLILDEKTVLMDTVDKRKNTEWLKNLVKELDGRTLDYLVILHLEPDHAGSINIILERYPNITLVGNAKTFNMLPNFFNYELQFSKITVAEGEELNFGSHTLQFLMAPMVHWPEVMVAYEKSEELLFSADAFGKFGTLDTNELWDDEARRYYFNIVGKYGTPVQALLKKLGGKSIKKILPLHGNILTENLNYYIEKYLIWSSYLPEKQGVTLAYASIHGNTAKVANYVADILEERNIEYEMFDLSRADSAEAVASAFKFSKMILFAASYDAGVFTPMEEF